MNERTRAGVRLRKWLKDNDRDQTWIAEQIGTSQQNVSAWMRGRPIPLAMAVGIRRVTKIAVEDWLVEAGARSTPPPRAA